MALPSLLLARATLGAGQTMHTGGTQRHLLVGLLEEALAALERAIALDATHVDAHVSRGNLLCDLARPAEALAGFDRALALDAQSAVAWLGRGNALFLILIWDMQRRKNAWRK